MEWTQKLPQEPGWYWVRLAVPQHLPGYTNAFVVQVKDYCGTTKADLGECFAGALWWTEPVPEPPR